MGAGTKESIFDITSLTLMRVNDICGKLDLLTVSNMAKTPALIRIHFGFLKSLYNNLQILLDEDDKKNWDEVMQKLSEMVFAQKERCNPEVFAALDKTEMELRRLQQRLGMSIQSKIKLDVKDKLKKKLVTG